MALLYAPNGSAHMLRRCVNRLVEIRVPARYLHSQHLVKRALFGTDVYTDDSDVVAMLAHTGAFPMRLVAPTKLHGVSVFCRVLPAQQFYAGSVRCGVASKVRSRIGRCAACLPNPCLLT